jgi:hypothetical protein
MVRVGSSCRPSEGIVEFRWFARLLHLDWPSSGQPAAQAATHEDGFFILSQSAPCKRRGVLSCVSASMPRPLTSSWIAKIATTWPALSYCARYAPRIAAHQVPAPAGRALACRGANTSANSTCSAVSDCIQPAGYPPRRCRSACRKRGAPRDVNALRRVG